MPLTAQMDAAAMQITSVFQLRQLLMFYWTVAVAKVAIADRRPWLEKNFY